MANDLLLWMGLFGAGTRGESCRRGVLTQSKNKVVKMKDKFFQRAFDRIARESSRRTRRLSLESLESREMLNVDWSGFGAENISTYEPSSSSASYSVELSGKVDVCDLTDVVGDGRNELVVVDYSSKTVSVYANTATNGDFTLKGSQTLSSLSGVAGYDSVIIDGASLTVVSPTADFAGLQTTEYQWNASSSSYVQKSQTTLDVSKFNSANASVFVFTGVDATVVNGDTLVVQATTLTTTGQSVKTALYSGYGTSSFGTNYRIASAISEKLMGSTTINGTDYLILNERTSSANNLVLASVGSTISKYSYDLSGYGSSLTFDWVVDYNGFIVVGAMTGGSSGLITIKSTTPTDGVDATTLGQWIACDSLKFNSSSAAAIGDVGGDSDPEIFTVNGSQYLFYNGDASSAYGYTFTVSDLVVSSPEYVSIDIEDIDGDGETEAILVGKNRLYTATVSSSGSVENVTSRFTFSEPVKKAVFGDFNGNGLVDVAVQFQANVGSGVQAFQQLSDGSFVALASQTFSSSIADIAVGKFSQTSVDEIAVLTVRSGASSSVNAIKLNGSAFTVTRSYLGSGIVGAALTAGSIYGSSVDDLVVVNSTQDTVTVLKNSGSALTGATITTAYDSTSSAGSNPVAAAIGDFNGDGLADVAVLNSSAGANYANIVYYLRSSEGGLGSKPAGKALISGTTSVSGLIAADLNSDGYSDLTYARKTTNGRVYASVLMGNGATSVFDPVVNKAITVDFSSDFDFQLAPVDSGNVSYDLIWTQDKSVGVLLNADDTVASGSIQFVVQSLSSAAGNTRADALSTQRTWIDEWSNFYVDIWASADGAAVTSATAAFAYNGSYFKLAEVKAASGYTVSHTDAADVVTATATGSHAADSDGWVLVARMKFEPAGGAGVELPGNGRLAAVDPGFSATATAQTLNGASVSSVSVPSTGLYPFIFDVDESGTVNNNDLAYFLQFLGYDVDDIANAKYRDLDYDQNGVINNNDLAYFLQFIGASSSDGRDSIYYSEPAVSSAVLDSTLSAAVLETTDSVSELFEEETIDSVAESVAFYGPTRPDVAMKRSLAPVSAASFASVVDSEELDLELDVDLDVDF